MPSATAWRHMESMCPSRSSVSASRSSVQKAQYSGPKRRTSSSSACRLRAVEASRSSTHIPRRRFSSASSHVVASWSERMPAATYASSTRPDDAGRVPVDVLVQRDLGQHRRVAGDHRREVHHLRDPEHPTAAQQPGELARAQRHAR